MGELACWPTDSGRLNRKVVTHQANSLTQVRESSPAETSVLTTVLRRQPTKVDRCISAAVGVQTSQLA